MDDRSQIATGDDVPRPMEGLYLRDALKSLAMITAMADGLRFDLEPLSESDIADGMEPLSLEDVQGTLNEIARRITFFAMQELRATQDEWMRASDSIA